MPDAEYAAIAQPETRSLQEIRQSGDYQAAMRPANAINSTGVTAFSEMNSHTREQVLGANNDNGVADHYRRGEQGYVHGGTDALKKDDALN